MAGGSLWRRLQFLQGLTSNRAVALGGGGGTFDTKGNNVTLGGQITRGFSDIFGTGGLTKIGAGTLTLTGNNTYTGATSVNGGTLAVSADGSGRSDAFQPASTAAGAWGQLMWRRLSPSRSIGPRPTASRRLAIT